MSTDLHSNPRLEARLREAFDEIIPRLTEDDPSMQDGGLDVREGAREIALEPRRRSSLLGATAALLLVGGAAAVWSVSTRAEPKAAPAATPTSSDASVPQLPLATEPSQPALTVLRWVELEPPDFALASYSYVGDLSDGTAVLWNGREAMSDAGPDRDVRIAFFDRSSGEWTRSSRFPGVQLWGNDAEIVDGSIIVHQYQSDGSLSRFARYDLSTDTWMIGADLPAGSVSLAWAADATTIAAWTVSIDGGDGRILRSTSGGAWVSGAAAPFGDRIQVGADGDGARLVVYGGLTSKVGAATVPFPETEGAADEEVTEPTLGLGSTLPNAALDGGVYDMTTDEWKSLPASPLVGVASPWVMLRDEVVVVAGGAPATRSAGFLNQLGAFDLERGVWTIGSVNGTWRNFGVSIVRGELIANDDTGWWSGASPFTGWTRLPTADMQSSWQPIVLGEDRFLQAFVDGGPVRFRWIEQGTATDAPPTPWQTAPDTGWGSTIIPMPDGAMVIDPIMHVPWLLSSEE